jgi:hypothetical protein
MLRCGGHRPARPAAAPPPRPAAWAAEAIQCASHGFVSIRPTCTFIHFFGPIGYCTASSYNVVVAARKPFTVSQRPPLAPLATSAAPETPVAVVINAVMLAGQTAHKLMLLLGQQLVRRSSCAQPARILHA